MKSLAVIATWLICCSIALGSRTVSTSSYPTLLFQIVPASSFIYQNFIANFRDMLKGEKTRYSIPILPTEIPVSSYERFVLVEMAVGRAAILVTLAFDRITAGIIGFATADQISYFFNDVSDEIYESPLFNSTRKTKISSNGCFDYDLVRMRFDVELGVDALLEAYFQLASYPHDTSKEIAPSLVVVLQMIRDAARSKYAEEIVANKYMSRFLPTADLLVNSDSWIVLSNGIWNSENGLLPEPILLFDAEGIPYFVTKVDEIKSQMGLLLGKAYDEWCGYPVVFSRATNKIASV